MNYLSSVVTQSPTRTVATDIETKHHAGSRAHSIFGRKCTHIHSQKTKVFPLSLSKKNIFLYVCKDISESPVDDAVIDLKILMKLGAFNILLCDLSSSIADVRIQGKAYSNILLSSSIQMESQLVM